jgi:hypothetical protein
VSVVAGEHHDADTDVGQGGAAMAAAEFDHESPR